MKPRLRLLSLAAVACALGLASCRSARNDTTETEVLLSAVSFEISDSPDTPSLVPARSRNAEPDTRASIAEKAGTVRERVADGLRLTAGFLLYGVFKLVESSLGFDDDEDEYNSPSGQWADDRNQWLGNG